MVDLNLEDMTLVNNIMSNEPVYYSDEKFVYIAYPGVRPFRYVISNYGTVISLPSKRIMKPFDRKGYLAIEFAGENSGTKIKVSVHRLVAWHFVDGRDVDNGIDIVNHKNSCTYNNYSTNLEWCTISENVYHALNNDNTYFSQRKFNKETAKMICELFVKGYTPKEVFITITGYNNSNQDKSTYITIKNIYERKTYKNISKYYHW